MIYSTPAGDERLYEARLPLVLASASPRRKAFLASLGLAFQTCPCPETVEPLPEEGEEPDAYVRRAAAAKAAYAQTHCGGRGLPRDAVTLGVDTAVVLEGAILGKPKDADEAYSFLCRLAGRRHQVFSACVLRFSDGRERAFGTESRVRIWNAPETALRAYARSREPLDKAGGYAVQGLGAFLVESIEGSWSGVVGLPLAELVRVLLEESVIVPVNGSGGGEHACTGATE